MLRARRLLEAELLSQAAGDSPRPALPADDPQLAESLDNLAVILRNQKKLVEAKPYSLEALRIRRKALNPGDPDLAKNLQNLSVILRDQGKYAESEELTGEALGIYKKAFSPGNPAITKTLISLGKLKKLQKKPTEAEPLFREARENLERAIVTGRQNLPVNSADHTNNLHLLAQLDVEQKKPQRRRSCSCEAVLVSRDASPPDDLNLAMCLNSLGNLLSQSSPAEAETVFTELSSARLGLPRGSSAWWVTWTLWSRCCAKEQARRGGGIDEKRRCRSIAALPPDHPNLAASLSAQRNSKDDDQVAAEQLLGDSIAIYRRAYPAGELATARARTIGQSALGAKIGMIRRLIDF